MIKQAFLRSLIDESLKIRDEDFALPKIENMGIELKVRRFDKIHPEISGNKVFKLYGWLHDADLTKPILSFGGAYSNHLLAISAFGKATGTKTIGIIRGEEPIKKNLQLLQMISNGMEVFYVNREMYKQKTGLEFLEMLRIRWGDFLMIPEGGAGMKGAEGAALMIRDIEPYDYIVIPAGTGTSALGIAMKLQHKHTKVICFQVLKGENMIANEIKHHTEIDILAYPNLSVNDEFHFGGYAKSNKILEDFLESFFMLNQWKPDLVYGAKALYGLQDLINKGAFPKNTKVLYMHTGGVFV